MEEDTEEITQLLALLPETLAGVSLKLTPIASLAERWDLVLASQGQTSHRIMAAALGLSWARFRRRHPYLGDAVSYGGLAIETLLKEGATIAEILHAGRVAYSLALVGLVSVEEADTFSETPSVGANDGE